METLESCRKKTKNDHFELSHSDEKCRRGALGFFNIPSVAKYQKTRTGDSFETLKNFRRKFAQFRKKIERGDPLVSSGFVGYVKKIKNERGSFGDKKIFRKKSRTVPKKSKGGTLSVPSGFVGYLEKVKRKGGTFGLSLRWPRTWP